jgi:hypothetical protein
MGLRERVIEALQGSFPDSTVKLHEGAGGKLFGLMVSSQFDKMPDRKRQKLLWGVLTKSLPLAERACITSIMAFSPDEDNLMTESPPDED